MAITPRGQVGLFEALPGDVLAAVDHARLAPLVDDAAHACWRAVAHRLAVPVHTVCYECRLADDDARVDFAVLVQPMRRATADDALGPLGAAARAEPAWRRGLDFLAAWSDPRSPWAAAIPFICAAFDAPSPARAALPAPGLSLCIDRGFFARQLGLPTPPAARSDEVIGLIDACRRALQDAATPAACAARVTRVLASDDVIARHVSFMVSRAPAAVKLDVRLPIDGVVPLLRRIAWPGDAPRIAAQLRALAPWPGHVQLNLIVHPDFGDTLEVELLTARDEVSLADRFGVLDRLVAAGACAAGKAAVLRDAWLAPVSRGGVIVARSWYLKLALTGDAIARAKAYLALMPRVLA